MKIYNGKNFAYGLFMAFLGIALLVLDIVNGFEWKENIISWSCLIVGAIFIYRSFSKKLSSADKLEERDERNRLVLLKNRSMSFQIHRFLCLGAAAVFFAISKITASEMFMYIAIGLEVSFAISLFVDIATFIYYESRN